MEPPGLFLKVAVWPIWVIRVEGPQSWRWPRPWWSLRGCFLTSGTMRLVRVRGKMNAAVDLRLQWRFLDRSVHRAQTWTWLNISGSENGCALTHPIQPEGAWRVLQRTGVPKAVNTFVQVIFLFVFQRIFFHFVIVCNLNNVLTRVCVNPVNSCFWPGGTIYNSNSC